MAGCGQRVQREGTGSVNAARRNMGPLVLFGFCLMGFALTPFDPYGQLFLDKAESGFVWSHAFGVDELGQDVLSRVWRGSANTICYAFLASVGTLLLSTVLLTAERKGGRSVSQLILSLVSLGIAVPVMFLGLLFMIFMDRSPSTLSIAIAIAGVPLAFRQLRILWIEQNAAMHVEASRAVGGDDRHVFLFSLLPNIRPQLFELWKLAFAVAILELSALTFLGLAGDPNWAELGTLLHKHQKHLLQQPLLVIWPGVTLCAILWTIRRIRPD
ncbi:MAG: hypothetical protein CBD18_05935 [Opitutales bacterium TMED158]|nr:MAG: hypothetical protein CBD18_05935 [Opitutales bacterium TMED158]